MKFVDGEKDPDLCIFYKQEYMKFKKNYNSILRSSYKKLYFSQNEIVFVADGLEGESLSKQLYNKLTVYGAERTREGLIIHRGIHFDMSPLLFFYTKLTYKQSGLQNNNIFGCEDFSDLEMIKYFDRKQSSRLVFQVKSNAPKELLFEMVDDIEIIEDYGRPVLDFPEGIHLGDSSFLPSLKQTVFPLVGSSYYSTRSLQNGSYCVLVARTDNQYDDHAVQVLRWIPSMISSIGNENILPLFMIGHISRNSNKELHEEMCKTNNQILFAKYQDGGISIIGNLSEYNDHFCEIRNYALPYSLFNLIGK